jgi:tetratricopeptide (TPR) repeat protein
MATRLRRPDGDKDASLREAHPRANALFDLGRFPESAALFDSITAIRFAESPSRNSRHRAWNASLAATGYAAAGDTARLVQLESLVATEGSRSGYRRDQLLVHYVRGLRLRLSGRRDEAIAEFRRSLYSPVEGNARASLELARTLVDGNRAAEAIPVTRAALAGPIGASNQYANRTELEYVLARAYDAAGRPDSAAAHYRWVLNAWRNADPVLHARRRMVRDRLLALGAR